MLSHAHAMDWNQRHYLLRYVNISLLMCCLLFDLYTVPFMSTNTTGSHIGCMKYCHSGLTEGNVFKVFKYIIFDVLFAGLYTVYKYNYIQLSIRRDVKLLEMLSHMFAMDAKLKALSLKVCKYITYDVLSAVWSVHNSFL